jgi:molybdenum cofactor cytidylyltransferase
MITALILAAGQSKRMGLPKLLLPWGETTVLGNVIEILQRAEINDILIITGGGHQEIESISRKYGAQSIFNDDFARTEMLGSIQIGLRAIAARSALSEDRQQGALMCLGDQPQIQEETVRLVCRAFINNRSELVVPSYQMRRGHPWLVARPLWEVLLRMKSPQSPRDFLQTHASEIEYVNVDSPTVIEDLDTPEDYMKFKP